MEFVYELMSAGNSYMIKAITLAEGEALPTQLIIPDVYKGLPVIRVEFATDDSTTTVLNNITDLVFGNNVKLATGKNQAMLGGSNLERVYIGSPNGTISGITTSSGIGANVTDIYYHPDYTRTVATENSAGLPITHHKGYLNIKYQIIGDYVNKTPLLLEGFSDSGAGGGTPTLEKGSIKAEHLAQFAVTEDKIAHGSVNGSHLQEKSVGNSILTDSAVTDEKIQNKTITKGKMAFDVATEDFVRNSIRNISGGKPLIGDVVSILDEFEGYEIHQVVKTTDLIPKNWSNVKVWSADDGITDTEANPMNFDFSQISETNYVKTNALPSQIDFSSIEGKNIICSMVFQDEEVKKFICVQLMQPTGSNATLQFIFYNGENEESCYWSYTAENGWADSNGVSLTENDLAIPEGTYPSLKIVDFASLHKDNPEVAPEGVEVSPEFLLDIFLKNWMQVYYPMGYYLTDKSADSIPKSWAEVQRVVRNGQASRVFNIGDQLICEKNGIAHVWDIIGIDYDEPLNPNYKHSITLQLNTTIESSAFDDNSNDYSLSTVREYLNGDYLTGFDEDFLSVLGGIRKSDLLYNTDEESSEDDAYPGSDVFFLLSEEEVSVSPYEFYSSAEVDPTIRIKSTGIKNTGLANWWLRTGSETEGASRIVNTSGAITSGSITRSSYYLAPACVIY